MRLPSSHSPTGDPAAIGRRTPAAAVPASQTPLLNRRFFAATVITLIEFDRAKDASNQSKHGVSLSLAAEIDWNEALVWIDTRFDYRETRMIALAPCTGALYCVVFVDRAWVRRIISLRRANRREVKHYVQST